MNPLIKYVASVNFASKRHIYVSGLEPAVAARCIYVPTRTSRAATCLHRRPWETRKPAVALVEAGIRALRLALVVLSFGRKHDTYVSP